MSIEKKITELEQIEDQIFLLNKKIAEPMAELQEKRNKAKEALDLEIAKIASEELKSKDYGCGTHNIETNLHKIKVVVSKTIKWDEAALKSVEQKIKEAGQDPEAFIKYKRSVAETSYKNFPDQIKKEFEPARIVTPSKPKIQIERK